MRKKTWIPSFLFISLRAFILIFDNHIIVTRLLIIRSPLCNSLRPVLFSPLSVGHLDLVLSSDVSHVAAAKPEVGFDFTVGGN